MMAHTYFGVWHSHQDMARDFRDGDRDPIGLATDEEVIFAAYEIPGYEGYCLVVYQRAGHLYEVNGAHCSCNGLEGQWAPEETTTAALAMRRIQDNSLYDAEAIARFHELFPPADDRIERAHPIKAEAS